MSSTKTYDDNDQQNVVFKVTDTSFGLRLLQGSLFFLCVFENV